MRRPQAAGSRSLRSVGVVSTWEAGEIGARHRWARVGSAWVWASAGGSERETADPRGRGLLLSFLSGRRNHGGSADRGRGEDRRGQILMMGHDALPDLGRGVAENFMDSACHKPVRRRRDSRACSHEIAVVVELWCRLAPRHAPSGRLCRYRRRRRLQNVVMLARCCLNTFTVLG